MKTICASGRVTTPWMDVRVVCGLSATMATFWPTRALIKVDFPAFGRPMMETNPDLNSGLGSVFNSVFIEALFIEQLFGTCRYGLGRRAARRRPVLRGA